MPVSAIIISAGVVIGALIIRVRLLLSIVCTSLISVIDGVHVSAPHSRVGIMQVCISLNIADISILLYLSFPAGLLLYCPSSSLCGLLGSPSYLGICMFLCCLWCFGRV